MNEKPPYRKWVGVVMGFLLHGSAHFLSGRRTAGLKWYFGLFACGVAAVALVATPGTVPFIAGATFGLASVVLWMVMLKQSYRPVRRIGFLGWLAVIVLAVVLNNGLSLLVRQFVHPFTVPTGAMAPTVQPGDYLFVERISTALGEPERGDIVVFKTQGIPSLPAGTFYIKRVAGLPGDRVRIEPPNLIVNDQVVDAPAIFARISSAEPPFAGFALAFGGAPIGALLTKPTDEISLGKDEVLVLGDNTRNSRDSRYWGPVPRKNIVGKATRIYWPLNRIDQSLGTE